MALHGASTPFSQNLVGSINGFAAESHIPRAFTCFILLPIIGNVGEHLVATSFALQVGHVKIVFNGRETVVIF